MAIPAAAAAQSVDEALLRLIRGALPAGRATAATAAFSKLGEHGAIWVVIGVAGRALSSDQQRKSGWQAGLVGVGAAYVTNVAVKQIFRRPRPQLDGLPQLIGTPTQLSFPSSHAASSFAAAAGYAGLLPRPVLLAGASSLALSRLFLGVHYPSDIVAGAVLGTVIGRVSRSLLSGAPVSDAHQTEQVS